MSGRVENVVVAHGLFMPGIETWPLQRNLSEAGFEPLLFRFPTVRATLSENVERLAAFIAAAPGDLVHCVGFSLGGVVCTATVAQRRPPNAGRIVCLGAPLNGSHTGKGLMRFRIGLKIVGESIAELNSRGGLGRWEGPGDLGVIAGSRSFGMGRFFGRLPRPNDGTVAVEETRLEGLTDHLVMPVTHTTMLFDREVARQTVAFLRHGRFDRGG